jgi:N-sulfoglucosamine sulfohydrolase
VVISSLRKRAAVRVIVRISGIDGRKCVLSESVYISVLLLLLFTFALCPAVAAEKPNILLIVSEDNGQELGCYGEPFVKTPVLDELADQGVRFHNAYVPQAGCSQSRAALLTGLYPHQNGQIGLATWKFQMYDEQTPNIVRSLKAAGFRTGIIGKLHINPASAFPFDMKQIPSANFSRKKLGDYAKHAEDFFTAGEEPFFLSVNYPDAHRPFVKQARGLPGQPLTGDDVRPLNYFGLDTAQLRDETANYYNCMGRLDSLIGDLLATLRRSGKAENT